MLKHEFQDYFGIKSLDFNCTLPTRNAWV